MTIRISHTSRLLRLIPILAFAMSFGIGCSAVQEKPDNLPEPLYTAENTLEPGTEYALDVNDPWEGFNRRSYKFNYYFDKFLFLPVVRGYDFVAPNYVQDRLENFVDNVFEFGNFTNNLLQGKFKRTGITLARFCINTTVGIFGLWDPATKFGLQRYEEDFGQTLGKWGVGAGPYVVLPIFGPSSLRDTAGLGADAINFATFGPAAWVDNSDVTLAFALGASVVQRNRQSFRYYQSGSPFEYEMIRMLYQAKREIEIKR
jgi:phospholipid-binding lipoprotein MlaA